MTYCPCCGEDVPRGTKARHLRTMGWKNVKEYVEKNRKAFTARVFDRVRKRQRTEEKESSDEEGIDDHPSKIPRQALEPFSEYFVDSPQAESPNRHLSDAGTAGEADEEPPGEYQPMDIDGKDLSPPPVLPLRTTRPRLVPLGSSNDSNSDSSDNDDAAPPLTIVDPEVPDKMAEPELEDELLSQVRLNPYELLEGELASEESQRPQGSRLTEAAMNAIRAHNLKVSIDLGARAYTKTKRAFPQLKDLPSLAHLQSEITFLSGVTPVRYDCCSNSCCCFVGPYADLDTCPYCDAARYDSQRRPRATFDYLPLIPRLQAMFADKGMCEKLGYRARFKAENGKIRDIFDSFHYQRL
ncbi:hypothetical protein R3P38DRAFT_3429840 [Favolaschia claudopus]|uniref:Uncharacterized protein n=1 Tax=Favolaschia claudopus TaxID=2862362 RepID=A0AAV9ZUI5_9AGAR